MREGRDVWLRRPRRNRQRRLPRRGDERRRPAVHPLHLRLYRQTQGRPAHLRRLSRLGLADPRIRLRLQARRHLLVHRRCRLGHRPFLHRLRPARERRHDADVRGRPELSGRLALLAGRRRPQGQHLLHRPHRPARAHGRRATTSSPGPRARHSASWVRSASRSTRRPGSGITASSATDAAPSSIPGGRPKPAAS